MYWKLLCLFLVVAIVMEPIGKMIKKRISNKWVAIGVILVITWLMLCALHFIAELIGINLEVN